MPQGRLELEQKESASLAAYAQLSAQSRGRQHDEPPPEWRTQFQRDRDRVIHSRAFRRLEYKTQVFLNGTGDHFRTRLTHSIEVAAISRNIARPLRLNEDLAETIALAHDLGHAPFGHTGEEALQELMRDHGGFEHNQQSLRIVESLEQKYPAFRGLNLSWEVREGLRKHASIETGTGSRGQSNFKSPSLEAQVADLADEITYYSHDLDDGLESGLLKEAALVGDVSLWREAATWVRRNHGALDEECRRYFTIRCLIDSQVRDVVAMTENLIREARVQAADDVRQLDSHLIQYSTRRRTLNQELREYLYQNLYYSPEVNEPNQRAARLLMELFEYYVQNPDKIGDQFLRRVDQTGLHRAVCDYIAGMTDRYLIQEHRHRLGFRLFDPGRSQSRSPAD